MGFADSIGAFAGKISDSSQGLFGEALDFYQKKELAKIEAKGRTVKTVHDQDTPVANQNVLPQVAGLTTQQMLLIGGGLLVGVIVIRELL